MARLVMVAGASGAGKSFLLENVVRLKPTLKPVRKLTTRPMRDFEKRHGGTHYVDLDFGHSVEEVEVCDYVYRYGNHWYGTRKADIDAILKKGQNPILIVRDCEAIVDIKHDYENALVLYCQGGLSGDDLRNKLKEQGRPDIEIDERMHRIKDDLYDYVNHVHLFDNVVVNNYEPDVLLGQMRTLLRHALDEEPIHPHFVFILMPFKKEFDEIYKAIKSAGKLTNGKHLRIERIDKRLGDFDISDEILRSIRQSGLIVCDITSENPNVFYELGYARGIRKRVVHCASEGSRIPFDISHFRHIFYKSPMDLQEKMIREFKYFYPST